MSPLITLSFVLVYFLGLFAVAYFTGKGATEHSFFIGNRSSNWAVVAYGMIGTSLSGVTFMSVPGKVEGNHFAYFQIVLGYLIGYFVVALVLLPLYYKLQLTSIYNYLLTRFGNITYKTGASFFLISRTMGATLRLFLVINVLQIFILDAWHVPFFITAIIVIGMILIYTFQGGVKTIVWTDMLQTTFMLLALVVCVWFIKNELQMSWGNMWTALQQKNYTEVFITDINSKRFFLKQIIGGAFITIAMTGLDQEMMQKNISCKSLPDAKKNMLSFSFILVLVNFIFLILGGVLYLYASSKQIAIPKLTDDLFPTIALNYLPPAIGIIFLIGLISALFPSADGALTALTASFCIDILGINRNEKINDAEKKRTRLKVHFSMAALFLICVIIFKIVNQRAIIDLLLDIAGYTYGPLLGLFAFGILTNRNVMDKFVPLVCIAAPVICYFLNQFILANKTFGNYQIGLELLLINGVITFVGLWGCGLFLTFAPIMIRNNKFRAALLTVFIVLLIDQLLKFYIKSNFMIGDQHDITKFFKLHFVENEGMAFGWKLGGSWGKLSLSLFRIVAVFFIGYYILRLIKANSKTGLVVAMSMIFAGAIGNIIDSVVYGLIFSESTPLQLAKLFPKGGGYAAMLHGKVVDMLYFPLWEGFLPKWVPVWGGEYCSFFDSIFNIADSSITIGVCLILVFQKSFFMPKEEIKATENVAAGFVETIPTETKNSSL